MPLGTLKRFVYASALAPLGRKSKSKNFVPSVTRAAVCPRPLTAVLPTLLRQSLLFGYEYCVLSLAARHREHDEAEAHEQQASHAGTASP